MPTSESEIPFAKRLETLEKFGLIEFLTPEQPEYMGAEEEVSSVEDAMNGVSPMTPEELQSLSEHLELAGATIKGIDPDLLQMPFEQALEGLKRALGEQGQSSVPHIIKCDAVGKGKRNREREECNAVAKARRSRFIQLSLVPEFVPAANAAIRSRLFTTGTGQRFKFEDFTPIATWHKNLEVSYLGEELRQEECSLWIQLCKFAATDSDFRISTTRYKILKALNKEDSGENRNVLKQQLLRLFKGQLRIIFGDNEYYGSILPDFAIENKGKGKIIANLNKTISKLLGIYDFTMINMDVRLSLPPMAQWFHAFVKSQEGPEITVPWEQIYTLSGSKETNLESYKKNFRKAVLKPLKDIGFILSAKSRGGKLQVEFDKRKG